MPEGTDAFDDHVVWPIRTAFRNGGTSAKPPTSRDAAAYPEESMTLVSMPQTESRLRNRREGRARTSAGRLNGTSVQSAAVAGVAVLGAFLRLWQLGSVGFNSDEAVYAGQAASIAGNDTLMSYFPIFRAHPLLFQATLSLFYRQGVSDAGGRVLAAAFGVATLFVVLLLGRELYGFWTGLVAMLFLAVMPYHVIVTRQVLLDGPMVLFATLALYFLVRFCNEARDAWLLMSALFLGLAALTKETSVVLLVSVYAFFALSTRLRLRMRTGLLGVLAMLLLLAVFPLSIALSHATSTGGSYLVYQLLRPANHSLTFYLSKVPSALGLLLVALALAGPMLVLARWAGSASRRALRRPGPAAAGITIRGLTWREGLLLCWAAGPILVFESLPVKGFQYLLPIAPVVAVLAAHAVLRPPISSVRFTVREGLRLPLRIAVIVVVALTMALPTWGAIRPSSSPAFLAGAGGLPGGREAGRWIDANLPKNAVLMTIGPSLSNLVEFYGHREALALSVSPNPLNRNPAYVAIDNPDLRIRRGQFHYLVWDTYSASRSPQFSDRLLQYANKYHGVAVHTETRPVRSRDGHVVQRPIITIYEVQP
jgi:4-amino-4-deoxy-L-arabinose transferase-like glycosyltransferase